MPLPEGLQVTLTNAGEGVGPFSPLVVVPWTVLGPYLARPPSGGLREPPYRGGRPLDGYQRTRLAAVEKGVVERAMTSQRYDAQQTWVLATVDGKVVSFVYEGGEGFTHRRDLAATCAAMPETVKKSLSFGC